jgi:hypothetical protein
VYGDHSSATYGIRTSAGPPFRPCGSRAELCWYRASATPAVETTSGPHISAACRAVAATVRRRRTWET